MFRFASFDIGIELRREPNTLRLRLGPEGRARLEPGMTVWIEKQVKPRQGGSMQPRIRRLLLDHNRTRLADTRSGGTSG
jgi:hypothetical protein